MPEGSDTLVPIENVEVIGNSIKIVEKVSQGFAVRVIGENYSKGEVLISKDSKIDFAHIGVLASLNIPSISVYKKPIVTVLSTGSEILDVGDIETNQSQIRSSNHFTIEAIAKKYGASVNQAGVITDDYNNIKNKIKDALKNSDIVVTTGGVSVGDYDFVKDIIKVELNAEIIFKGVKIKPGQHIVLAKTIDDRYILGLPGFAYSSTVTALIYLTKLIKLFLNQKSSLPIREAIIENDINRMTGKTEFRVANLNYQDGEYRVNFDNKKVGTSAILTNMIGNQITLVEFSPTDKNIKQGEKVKIIIL
jgi:molybdopterin molybdotransferase